MGQQPNIELEIADLPRPTGHPAAPQGWKPDRPGELLAPGDVPWGGMYGTPGPDTGFVLRLVGSTTVPLGEHERRHDADVAIAALAAARASHFGRGPTRQDVAVAMLILGYDREGIPTSLLESIATDRGAWLANIGHDVSKAQALVGGVALETLASLPDALRVRMAGGERLIDL